MKNLVKTVVIASVAFFAAGIFLYYSYRKGYVDKKKAAALKTSMYYLSVPSYADFVAIQGAPLSDKFNDVLSVKVVYDIHDRKLYFVNSRKFRYHYEFCQVALGDNEPLELFNTLNYGNTPGRSYHLANINYYTQSHIYTLEFCSEDRIDADEIATVFKSVRENSYIHDSLQLMISSDYLAGLDNAGELKMARVLPADIYKKQKFQMLNEGVTYGILRKSTDPDKDNFSERDIVLMKGSPVSVPICAGIITNAFQTPLSHINILCHNRNIPSAVDVNIWTKPEIAANIDKPVRMQVSRMGIEITPSTIKVIDSFAGRKAPGQPVKLKYNLTVTDIVPLARLNIKMKDVTGNKAAGFGELNKIAAWKGSKFSVPEGGFAIPFYFYQQHISSPAVSKRIAELAQFQQSHASREQIKERLKEVRHAIKEQPLDPILLQKVTAMIQANGKWIAYRFRSSANAEDVEGFSGAGLYESKTGKLNDTEKPIDMAIKKVWASAFNEEAYFERVASNIDEQTMMMGILVHRSFPDEKANGVAITRNIYRKNFPGFTINVQVGEVPVVSPPDSVTCEQFVCMKANEVKPLDDDVVVDYITYSNINNNKPVLTLQQVQQLYAALYKVRGYFYFNVKGTKAATEDELGLDIEFKFDKDNKLYLKQVRPYR